MVVGLSGMIGLILLAAAPPGLLPGILVRGGLYSRLSGGGGGNVLRGGGEVCHSVNSRRRPRMCESFLRSSSREEQV